MLTTTTTAFLLSSLLLAQGAPLPLPQDPSASSSSSSSSDPSLSVADQIQSPSSSSSPSDCADWAAPSNMTDLSSFSVEAYVAGQSNLQVLSGSPDNTTSTGAGDFSVASTDDEWDASINSVRVVYPKGSINPGQTSAPIGGAVFYAHPMDVTRAQNVTLEYEVYFPADFDFAKGGKLPGLYGGKDGCSGGDSAEDCFSTRLMWRQGGLGELYLYAPKTKQTPRLCKTPPLSVCNVEEGLSIGRGTWTFARGGWTTIRQDVWLNSAGRNDGGFNIWINGHLALTGNDVYYRDGPIAPVISSPSRRPQSVWKRITERLVTGLGLQARFDNGQWKGINGYPGDPGFNGSPNLNAVSATDDVYTYEFTEVVTWPHALPTVTVTVTADPAPTDPPADDPPADDAPAKRQWNQDDTSATDGSQSLDNASADAQADDSSLDGTQPTQGSLANTDLSDSSQIVGNNANTQAQTQGDNTDIPAQSTENNPDANTSTSPTDGSGTDEDIGAQAAKPPAKPAVKAPPPKAPAKPPVAPKPPVPAPKPPVPAPAPPAKVVTVTAPAPPAKTVTLPAPPPIVVTAPAPPAKTVTAPAPPPIIVTAVPAPIIVTAPAPPPVIYTVPAQVVTVTVNAPAAAITPAPVVIVTPQQGKSKGSFRHHQQAVLQPIPAPVYGHGIGFKGLHFSTFFGGHSQDWASPKDQHSFFRRFKMRVNQ